MRLPRPPLVCAVALLLAALAAPASAAADAPACGAPPELLEASEPLPEFARALAHAAAGGGPVRILAVGSASVLGPGTSGPGAAWPARLEALLAARPPLSALPNGGGAAAVEVAARGGRGLTAADHLAIITQEVARSPRPALVLWQAGIVEAVRNLDADEMVQIIGEGVSGLQARGIDVVMVDPQFSRFLRANADVPRYRDALGLAAAAQGVGVFPRYELMRAWAESDRVDVERAARGERAAATDQLNDCLARALAVFLAKGVAAAAAAANGASAQRP